MNIETRHIALNYLAAGSVFIIFAFVVGILDFITEDGALAYVLSTFFIGAISILEGFGYFRVFRGFVRYCFFLIICTAAFPLDDLGLRLGGLLYIAFVGMVLALGLIIRKTFIQADGK
jgi:hypothetical protein